MSDRRFPENVTLHTPDPANPGSFLQQTVPAVFMERSELGLQEPDRMHDRSVFLLKISSAVPPGSYLMRNTRRYDIASVKVCRDLSGAIFACRCSGVSSS